MQIRVQILLFTLIPIRILLFNLFWIQLFDSNPDPYCSKEVMYLKQYFLYIYLIFIVSRSKGRNQKAYRYFVKFSLPVNFVVGTH